MLQGGVGAGQVGDQGQFAGQPLVLQLSFHGELLDNQLLGSVRGAHGQAGIVGLQLELPSRVLQRALQGGVTVQVALHGKVRSQQGAGQRQRQGVDGGADVDLIGVVPFAFQAELARRLLKTESAQGLLCGGQHQRRVPALLPAPQLRVYQAGIGQRTLPAGRVMEGDQAASQACLQADIVTTETCRGTMVGQGAVEAELCGGQLFAVALLQRPGVQLKHHGLRARAECAEPGLQGGQRPILPAQLPAVQSAGQMGGGQGTTYLHLTAELALNIRVELVQPRQGQGGVQGPVGQDGAAAGEPVVTPADVAVQLQALLMACHGGCGGQRLLANPACQF